MQSTGVYWIAVFNIPEEAGFEVFLVNDAGEREVPFDKRGLMKSALIGRWNASKRRKPDDLVFSTRKGDALGRRNLLRHIKIAAKKLGVSKAVDFRSGPRRQCADQLFGRQPLRSGGSPISVQAAGSR